MSLSRVSVQTLRHLRPKASSGGRPFFSEGMRTDPNGILFCETPPPPGQSRKWESWEASWYGGMLIGPALLLGFGLTSKPDTSWVKWARKEARKELKEEGVL